MRIILNADDFGQDEDTLKATIECFQRGALTSATIMPRMPATRQAIKYAKKHPEFSFGAHLTFVSDGVESPLSDPKTIPNLVDGDGLFLPSQKVRILALCGKLPLDQIEREMTAQLAFLRDHGVSISHVDSHGHLHKFRPFVKVLGKVLPKFGIKRVRTVQNVYLRKLFGSPTYWMGPIWRQRIMNGFITTDHFFTPTSVLDARLMHGWMPAATSGATEIGVHPGYAEEWRNEERQALQAFAAIAREAGHHLITWGQL
ncbi:MAG: carbohydrate deacetylase [Gammaproteobacteria bacterium]